MTALSVQPPFPIITGFDGQPLEDGYIFSVSPSPRMVYINGVYQNQNTYSIVGSNVVFSQTPPVTSIIEFVLG